MTHDQQSAIQPRDETPLIGGDPSGRHLLFVAWRDLASPRAGGSEILVDELAAGMLARGDRVTLLCGGRTAGRPYQVVRSGGTYTQFLKAPVAYWRGLRDCDLVVEVCNGMPFFAPLWTRRPTICLVNHVHTELWGLRFPAPVAAAGRFAESRMLPWAHRNNLFLTVSPSTADALREIGVADDRIRQICNGVVRPDPLTPRSTEPLFLALGRLTEYKRIDLLLRLWERVRGVTGGTLVIAGDGPEHARLKALAGEGVVLAGRVSEAEKHRLLCSAWMLLHPALIEGWGIVIAEAAIRGTPAIGFDVPGLRDSVVNGVTGTLAKNEGQFAQAWASLTLDPVRRRAMGAAARQRAERLRWSDAVNGFAKVSSEALARATSNTDHK
jgi:glycosyltransferase involved in cell wall biosynthesis